MRQVLFIVSIFSFLFAEPEKSVVITPPSDSIKVEVSKPERVHDYRYQIVGAVTMMLFFGLAIGTSESMNPR